jgi:hypothetical protein
MGLEAKRQEGDVGRAGWAIILYDEKLRDWSKQIDEYKKKNPDRIPGEQRIICLPIGGVFRI